MVFWIFYQGCRAFEFASNTQSVCYLNAATKRNGVGGFPVEEEGSAEGVACGKMAVEEAVCGEGEMLLHGSLAVGFGADKSEAGEKYDFNQHESAYE